MDKQIMRTLTFCLILTGAGASAQPQDAVPALPRMQITELTGDLRIEARNRSEGAPGRNLPFIQSGSVVRVLSGRAEFESDYHAIIQAGEGDSFRFTATAPYGARPGQVRIAALALGSSRALSVGVGDKRFRIHRDGALTIAGTSADESTVRVEGGSFEFPAADVSQMGSGLTSSRGMHSARPIVVKVSESPEFASAPVILSGLSIMRKSPTSFEVRAGGDGESSQALNEERVKKIISRWPGPSQRAAELIISKYGRPDTTSSNSLVWIQSGPWKRTTVYRHAAQDLVSRKQEDVIRQSINYDVPHRMVEELAEMEMGLSVDGDHKELSATSDSEESNFLAINLADEVIRGAQTLEEARAFYAKTLALSVEGKTSSYTQSLLFPQTR